MGQEFRGALQLAAYRWLAWEDAQPVGYIDCGTFDRFVVYGGEGPHGPIIHSTIERRTGHIAIVVDPGRRRRGVGRAMIRALLDRPELEDASLLVAGIEPDNVASLRCFEAVGFRRRAEEPDWEGMLDLVLDRGGPA